MSLTCNVHNVEKIEVQRVNFGNFVNTTFRFTDDRGAWHDFTAFSTEPLELVHLPDRLSGTAAPANPTVAPDAEGDSILTDAEYFAKRDRDDEYARDQPDGRAR